MRTDADRPPATPPGPDPTPTRMSSARRSIHAPVLWGLVFGVINAASPLALRWLDQATVLALVLTLIAAVYIGFAVADGRPRILAVETAVAAVFVVLACAAMTATPWILVAGYAGHGIKDYWQHRRQFVAGTRWWPPFCATVDWLVAGVLGVEIVAGVAFR